MLRFLDLFAGIGGFRTGMTRAGHKCVGYVEWDKFARKSYEAMYDTKEEWTDHDITSITEQTWQTLRGSVDVICGGFPCQAFSIAGKQLGFTDTRGTMFFELARAAKAIEPQFLLFENVKGLLNHDQGKTFRTILATIDELGYDAEWQVFNSKNYVPQHRERVFIVGHSRKYRRREIFPIHTAEESATTIPKIKRFVDGRQNGGRTNHDVYFVDGVSPTLTTGQGDRIPKVLIPNVTYENDTRKVKYKISDVVPTILATCHKNGDNQPKIAFAVIAPEKKRARQNGRRIKEAEQPMFTLTTRDRHGVLILQLPRGYNFGGLHEISPALTSNSWEYNNFLCLGAEIRRLTPRECWRLQGFSDELFNEAQKVSSDAQLYRQAGNSVTVDVVYEIAKRLKAR